MIRKPEEQEQSVWLDHPGRNLVRSGDLAKLVQSGKVHGITVEPAMLAEVLNPSGGNTHEIHNPRREKPLPALRAAFIAEIRALADILHPAYTGTQLHEGYVSVPLNPTVAGDTEATLAEARRLWSEIARKNLLLAIPATDAGIPAISALIAEGINANATMLFTPRRYEQAALSYMEGLESLPPAITWIRATRRNLKTRKAQIPAALQASPMLPVSRASFFPPSTRQSMPSSPHTSTSAASSKPTVRWNGKR
ncbi:MAG TPA: transaldolase family protein [Nitrosospira sp.]|nr:transaldolase family protein [Nitrosospira sp.]